MATPGDAIPVARVRRREQTIVTGSPRTHVSKRKRRVFRPPQAKVTNGFGPIPHPVIPNEYRPFTGPTPSRKPNTRDVGTSIIAHSSLLPKSNTFTKGDRRKQQCIDAMARLQKATASGFHWNSHMILVLLRFVFGLVVTFNWNWTRAVNATAKLCRVKPVNVFKFANNYIASNEVMSVELEQQIRGRGSMKFISNHGKDHFSKLKEVVHS